MRLQSPGSNDDLDDPTPQQVVAALRALDHSDNNPYLILTAGDGKFLQTIKKSPRRFFLEYREGVNGPQWSTRLVGRRDVEQAFLSYLAKNHQYRKALEWQDITKAMDDNRKKKLTSIAWRVHVLARAVLALNCGTAATFNEAELWDWMTKTQRKRFRVLTDALVIDARKISQFAKTITSNTNSNPTEEIGNSGDREIEEQDEEEEIDESECPDVPLAWIDAVEEVANYEGRKAEYSTRRKPRK